MTGAGLDAGAILAWILEHLTLALIPLLVWMTRSQLQVSQTIYGTKGDNGLNGSVKELRARTHRHATHLQRHEGVLDLHAQRMDGIDRDVMQLRTGGRG